MATAPEKYGSVAFLAPSEATAGVSSATRVYAFGSCPIGDLNTVIPITSMSEAALKLGCHPGDGYTLSEMMVAAFEVVGLGEVLCIPVSHDMAYSDAWKGVEELETGVYTYDKCRREDPGTVNILVAPSVTDRAFISALIGLCQSKTGEDIQSYLIYDVAGDASQIKEGGFVDLDAISEAKLFKEGCATAVWGCVRTSGGYSISGAAVRACVQAVSDAQNGAPSRVGGNIPLGSVVGIDGRGFGVAKRYPLFPNIAGSVGVDGDQADLSDLFSNPIISSHTYGYNLSNLLPMFAPNLSAEQFPGHLIMADGSIRRSVFEMTNGANSWSFKPVSGIDNGESIQGIIVYDKQGDVLANPFGLMVSATYNSSPIDLTSVLNAGTVNYVASCGGVYPYLTIVPQSVSLGGAGFLYDASKREKVVDPVNIVMGAVGNQPIIEGNVCFALNDSDADIQAFVNGNGDVDAFTMIVRKGGYNDLITLRKSEANSLSADGICAILCKYGTNYTWGDHTSAFFHNSVPDERDRFENGMRMQQYLANWLLLTFNPVIDDGMDLQLRNDIILACQTKLNSLVGMGALIGQPTCTFEAAENSLDSIKEGHFVFTIRTTTTLPAKYIVFKVIWTEAGLSVYTEEA